MPSECLDPKLWQFSEHLYSRARLHFPFIPVQIAGSEQTDVGWVNIYRTKYCSAQDDSKIGPTAHCWEWESSVAQGDPQQSLGWAWGPPRALLTSSQVFYSGDSFPISHSTAPSSCCPAGIGDSSLAPWNGGGQLL